MGQLKLLLSTILRKTVDRK